MGYSELAPDQQSEPGKPTRHVDLLLCVDAETLLAKHPHASQDSQTPTLLEGAFVYAIGPQREGLTEHHGELVEIAASMGQTIRVRTVALALRAEQTVVMYRFEIEDSHCLTPPALAVQQGLLMTASSADCPEQMHSVSADDYFWRTKVISEGDTRCTLDVMLVDPACKTSGYFRWATTLRVGLA